jgi:nitroimidazol reductase NimA-like FMN-containing flavoprotein (pyridoxamine 5'-phosphate oxidase superfamily)
MKRKMRRSDKEITDMDTIYSILKSSETCRIAFCDNKWPYIIPMNFAYDNGFIYLHSAREGRKIDILNENNRVCFEIDDQCEILTAENECNWGTKYRSIIGNGLAIIEDDIIEKKKGLDIIMKKYSHKSFFPKDSFEYSKKSLEAMVIIKIEIMDISGKTSGYD